MSETALKTSLALMAITCAGLYIWKNRESIDWAKVLKEVVETKKDF